ncbi:ACT domain-containing protein [Specibacter sp. NPDC057265]|uniref:ACT domain-containing protein n=1 Tax=Specibacter sp. NPDC057265 TaxID=3346075 RepID=UPI003634D46F
MKTSLNDAASAINLQLLPERLSIYRFEPSFPVAELPRFTGVWSITRTRRELSVVAPEGSCPGADHEDPGWRCLYLAGPIPFNLTGVVSGLTSVIAAQGLPVFVLSTFDSDLLLLRGDSLNQSLQALDRHGHVVHLEELPAARRQPDN